MGMNTTIDNISSLSFNSTGWSDFKGSMLNTILVSHSVMICAVQEHFLLDNNLYKLNHSIPQYDVFGLPAIKSNSHVHSGRPSSGLAIFYNKKISHFITHVSCPNSHRVQAVKLELPDVSYIFINCYFPVDRRNLDNDELLRVLQDVRYVINQCDDLCNIVMLGDLNYDLSRNTDFANLVKNFLVDNNISSVWTKFECDFTYAQSRMIRGVERSYF